MQGFKLLRDAKTLEAEGLQKLRRAAQKSARACQILYLATLKTDAEDLGVLAGIVAASPWERLQIDAINLAVASRKASAQKELEKLEGEAKKKPVTGGEEEATEEGERAEEDAPVLSPRMQKSLSLAGFKVSEGASADPTLESHRAVRMMRKVGGAVYKCSCHGETFASQETTEAHIRRHTGRALYCTACMVDPKAKEVATYYSWDSMNRHQRVAHNAGVKKSEMWTVCNWTGPVQKAEAEEEIDTSEKTREGDEEDFEVQEEPEKKKRRR